MSSTLDKLSKIKKFRLVKSNKMSDIQFKFNEIMRINRQRKIELEEDIDNYRREKELKRRREEQHENENFHLMTNVLYRVYTTEGILRVNERLNTERGPNVNRNVGKLWWRNVCFNWDNEQFKSKFRLTKDNFNIIVKRIEASIVKTPTNLVPEPIEPNRQLGLTINKLPHGCTFTVVGDVFEIFESLATQTSNHVVRELVANLFDKYVKMSLTEQEWINQIKGFIENYEFPCIGAWDGFDVYVCSKLKNHYNFKQRYSISNMGLVGYNKRFLNLTVGAPGSKHDARFLRNTGLFKQTLNGLGLPD